MSQVTKIPQDFSCPFVECAQFEYCSTKICSRWEAWFNDTWSKIHKQGEELTDVQICIEMLDAAGYHGDPALADVKRQRMVQRLDEAGK